MKTERKNIARWVLSAFMLFLLIYWFIFTGQQFLQACAPLFIGLVIAYPLNILIGFFREHDILYHRKIVKSEKTHRILTAALAVVVLVGCVAFIAGYLAPQLTAGAIALLDKVPGGIRYLLTLPALIKLIPPETMETLQQVDWSNWVNRLVNLINSDELVRGMSITASSALGAISNLMFGMLFSCYFLSGKEKLLQVIRRGIRAFVPPERQENTRRALVLLNECFRSFIVCQAMQALIIGISATVLMHVFGFPYASMIGSMNGFCALIPVIGGYLGAILGTLMILTDSPGMALFFLIFIVVLQNAIGTFVFPKLIGRTLQLPSAVTLTAVLIGSGIGGISGILLGVPLAAFAYRMGKEKLEEQEARMGLEGDGREEAGPEKPAAESKKAPAAKIKK